MKSNRAFLKSAKVQKAYSLADGLLRKSVAEVTRRHGKATGNARLVYE